MRNRAKCSLCNDIIESLHTDDTIACSCGEISVMGGDKMQCAARKWKHFIRIDDQGNEVVPKIEEKELSRYEELMDELSRMIAGFERLPTSGMIAPVSHYDFSAALMLFREIVLEIRSS